MAKHNKNNDNVNFEIKGGNNGTPNEEEKVFNNEEYELANDPYSLNGGSTTEEQQSAFGNNNAGNENLNQGGYGNMGENNYTNDYSNIGQEQPGYFDTNMNAQQWAAATETEVARFIRNNRVFELTIGVEKDQLLTFANNSLPIPKRCGYREMKENELLELLKGIDITDFQNAKRTYFPSTQQAITTREGVKSIISFLIADNTLQEGQGKIRNIVDLARRTSNFEVERVLKNLDTSKLFDPHITVPHKRYEENGVVEIFVNTTVVLLSFLGLSLEAIKGYSFTVKEQADLFLVHLQKL